MKSAPHTHLKPPGPADALPITRLLQPFTRFLGLSSAGGILVLICTVIALAIANSPWHHAYEELLHAPIGLNFGETNYSKSIWHLINDGLMAVFFLLVGLEIKREILLGELQDPRKAALPLIAALGGMIVPAAIYAVFNHNGPGSVGWGIPMATDIAFALGVLRLVGGVPASLLIFLAALAIADDLGAVLVIALFYTNSLSLFALGTALAIFVILIGFGLMGVRHPLPYILGGIILWLAILNSGIHATVAGVLLAFCIPARGTATPDQTVQWTAQFSQAELLTPNTGDTIEHLSEGIAYGRSPMVAWEHALGPWVNFVIVPVFALANAGVVIDAAMLRAVRDPVFWGVSLGLLLGKPMGVVGASLLALRLRWATAPASLTTSRIVVAGVLAGIGFTMAIFIAGLAFEANDVAHLAITKAAVLAASGIAGVVGFVLCRRVRDALPAQSHV